MLFDENGTEQEARQLADLYAAEGYAALCAPAIASDDDGAAAIAVLRHRPECSGKVAAIGFGRGGTTALRAAADHRIDCAICYCPVDTEAVLALASRIACPVVLHCAENGPAASSAATRVKEAFAGRPELGVYVYPGTGSGFERKSGAHFDRAAAGLAHSRSIALLRRVVGPHYDLEALWEAHTRYEFEARDVNATMATMVGDPYVNHVPVMTGGVGRRELARFYANHFIPKLPGDTRLVPISRTIGADCVVDEMLFCFTHDTEIDFMLPGVSPTGRYVEVPTVAIVKFRGDKLCHEHIYWDQASVLVQIGLLDPKGLPVAGAESAKKLVDETLPSNTLMQRWVESASRGE
jgi:carboxymethylenebutenolidase